MSRLLHVPSGTGGRYMVKSIGISIPEWLFEEIETRRGKKNRSEYLTETIVKGMGGLREEEA